MLWDIPRFYEATYLPIRLLGRSKGTIADMRSFCNVWARTMGPVEVRDIDLATAANFLRAMARDHSAATVNKYRAYLLSMLREARRAGITEARWFRRLPRLPEEHRIPTAWNRDQVEAILRVATIQPGQTCGIPLCKWWSAVLLTMVNTALRIGALLSVKTLDVSLDQGWMVVRARRQKQKREQFFRLNDRTVKAIRAIYEPQRLWLFPWVACRPTLQRHLARICLLAGVPAGGHSGLFHRGRTTAVSHAWVLSSEYARQLAGHASIQTTLDSYVDPRVMPVGDHVAGIF